MSKRVVQLSLVVVAFLLLIAGGFWWSRTGEPRPHETKTSVSLRMEAFNLNLTPTKLFDIDSRRIGTMLHAGLVVVDQSGTVRPAIAQSWKRDGNTWNFVLRDGLTFSDGSPITSQAVRDSLCAALQPSVYFSWALASIEHKPGSAPKTVECTGIVASDKVVKITEAKPVPWFLEALGSFAAWIVPVNAQPGPYGVVPGAGPYTVQAVVPDSHVSLSARKGGPIEPGFAAATFRYITDDARAAAEFTAKKLDVLEIASPTLAKLLLTNDLAKGLQPQKQLDASLTTTPTDRIRIVMIGEKKLQQLGFSPQQISSFKREFSAAIDRRAIAGASLGIGVPTEDSIVSDMAPQAPAKADVAISYPAVELTVLTESDQFSDLIASMLPKKIGAVSIQYKGLEKSRLIDSVFKGEYELVSIVFEGTHHSLLFWSSFFTPGNSLTAFAKEISDLKSLDPANPSDAPKIRALIQAEGNWIGVLREHRVILSQKGIDGLRFNPTGQASFDSLRSK